MLSLCLSPGLLPDERTASPSHRLENALRNWSALTAGDVIVINYNKKYAARGRLLRSALSDGRYST